MSFFYKNDTTTLLSGDCRRVLSLLDPVDTVITDPPYGLSFMGKGWDRGVPGVEFWEAISGAMKPGAHLLAFGGTRTFHRLTCAIEDAGFEIRDCLMWVYGTGFPKSLDVSKAIDKAAGVERVVVRTRRKLQSHSTDDKRKVGAVGGCYNGASPDYGGIQEITAPETSAAQQWDGWGTALKPAWEPIILARKPLIGTVAANVLEHGTGGINIDGCRVPGIDPANAKRLGRNYTSEQTNFGGGQVNQIKAAVVGGNLSGRWPANLIHDGSEEVVELFPSPHEAGKATEQTEGADSAHWEQNIYGRDLGGRGMRHGDAGSAARFFFQAELGDDEWLDRNLPLLTASSAVDPSSLSNVADAIARRAAAIGVLQEGRTCVVLKARSTNVTVNESRRLCENAIGAILTIAPASSQGLPQYELSLKSSPVKVAVKHKPTGTTMITVDLWRSDGSADPVTFSITPSNSEAGAQDSASRLIYCAKASKSERSLLLSCNCETKSVVVPATSNKSVCVDCGAKIRSEGHPTQKPLALMRYLVRLVTPQGGVVLDPFMGSGSTLLAAQQEGFRSVGIDLDEAYCRIATDRLMRDKYPWW